MSNPELYNQYNHNDNFIDRYTRTIDYNLRNMREYAQRSHSHDANSNQYILNSTYYRYYVSRGYTDLTKVTIRNSNGNTVGIIDAHEFNITPELLVDIAKVSNTYSQYYKNLIGYTTSVPDGIEFKHFLNRII